jgi:hypothetical protein
MEYWSGGVMDLQGSVGSPSFQNSITPVPVPSPGGFDELRRFYV